MSDEQFFDSAFAAVSSFFVGGHTMHETLQRVLELAVDALPAVAYTGITMMRRGRPSTGVFSDPQVPDIDQRQYEVDAGPCVESLRTGEILQIESTAADRRWPEFSRDCLDHGIHSTLSLPLTVDGDTHGAINFYATSEDAFGPRELRTASSFASRAAVVLANAAAYWTARSKAEQLETALATRVMIEQAKKLIMDSLACDDETAFSHLVQRSRDENRKLREVAEDVVGGASRRR
jgi:GAF domain-containing protein